MAWEPLSKVDYRPRRSFLNIRFYRQLIFAYVSSDVVENSDRHVTIYLMTRLAAFLQSAVSADKAVMG